MQIIIVNQKQGQSRSLAVRGWARVALSVCLLGLPVILGYFGYQFTGARASELHNDKAAQAWVNRLQEQGEEVGVDIADGYSVPGMVARLDQGMGHELRSAPRQKLKLQPGDVVRKGRILALAASSGSSGWFTTWPLRLHMHKHGRVVDAASYIHRTRR